MNSIKIGIIAGGGALPLEIIKNNPNVKYYIAMIVGECTLEEQLISSYPNVEYKSFALGSVGKVIEFFHEKKATKIIFAGNVKRPNLRDIKVDFLGAKLLSKILANKFLGDDNLLRIIIKFFEEYGFEVLSAHSTLRVDLPKTTYLGKSISAENINDINLALNIFNHIGSLDIGQALIVEDGYVLGIEAAEGTDNLIARCVMLRKKKYGGILIKKPKPNQDMRVDLPTIGIDTVKSLAQYNYDGLAVCFKGCIILNLPEVIDYVVANNLFIYNLENIDNISPKK